MRIQTALVKLHSNLCISNNSNEGQITLGSEITLNGLEICPSQVSPRDGTPGQLSSPTSVTLLLWDGWRRETQLLTTWEERAGVLQQSRSPAGLVSSLI